MFSFKYFTDASAQQERPTNATCMALDTLIANRNSDRVSNCMRGENCTYLACDVSGLGGSTRANVSFTTCDSPFSASVELVTFSSSVAFGVEFQTERTLNSNSTFNTSLEISNTLFLNITVDQSDNGTRFGVSFTANMYS